MIDEVEVNGLMFSLNEKADELKNLALRAKASEKDAEIIKQALDIIDNKHYSYLYQLLKTRGW